MKSSQSCYKSTSSQLFFLIAEGAAHVPDHLVAPGPAPHPVQPRHQKSQQKRFRNFEISACQGLLEWPHQKPQQKRFRNYFLKLRKLRKLSSRSGGRNSPLRNYSPPLTGWGNNNCGREGRLLPQFCGARPGRPGQKFRQQQDCGPTTRIAQATTAEKFHFESEGQTVKTYRAHYGSSGPAQLALALLAEVYGPRCCHPTFDAYRVLMSWRCMCAPTEPREPQ
jgi:hypothetical protein